MGENAVGLVIFLIISYVVIIVFGTVSNGLVILTYIRYRSELLSQSKHLLGLSLAVTDFIPSLFVIPFCLSNIPTKWTAEDIACQWYGFASTCTGLTAILQLAVIAIEQHGTISSKTLSGSSTKRFFILLCLSFLLALISSAFPLLGWSKYTPQGNGFYCAISWDARTANSVSYCAYLMIFFFVIPIIIIIVCYVKTYKQVKKLHRDARARWGVNFPNTWHSYEAKIKATKQIFIVTITFLVAWGPYAMDSSLVAFGNVSITSQYRELFALLAKTSYICNPIIYFFTYRALRSKVWDTVSWLCNRNDDSNIAEGGGQAQLQTAKSEV